MGVVEVQPALGLKAVQALGRQPALPGEPLHVLGAVGVARLHQRKLGQVLGAAQACAAFQQPGAGHGGQLFAKQALCMRWYACRHGVAQGQVDVRRVQIDGGIGGIDADVDVRVLALKSLQPRDQPHGRKRGPGADGHAFAPRTLADDAHRRVHALQRGGDGAQQLGAGSAHFHRPRMAQKQGHAHLVFQRLDLAAHRGLGQGQLFGGSAKVQVPGHGHKGAQVPGGDGPGAQRGVGCLHAAFIRLLHQ